MLRWIQMGDDDHRQKTVKRSWFVGVEKRAVLDEVIMCFGDPHIMDKRRCLQVMRKLLYLLNQGEIFTKSEASAVLFSATKLLRFEDLRLRRLVYLIADELCPIAKEGDILEYSNLLVDDLMNVYRPPPSRQAYALRLLSRSTNVPSSFKIEEYLKRAIPHSNRFVSSGALLCALHLLKRDAGIGIKVCEQVGKVATESHELPKFHALCLLSRMQEIESIRELASSHVDKILSYELKNDHNYKDISSFVCLPHDSLNYSASASGANEDYCKYIINRYLARGPVVVSSFNHILGNEMVAIEGLYSVMQLRNISGRAVKDTMVIAHRQLPDSSLLPFLFLDVRHSMLEWSRINKLLQIYDHDDDDDDAAQLAKSKTHGPVPRKRMTALQY